MKQSRTCLFVCDFNAIRSTLSHLTLKKKNISDLTILSAGMNPGTRNETFNQLAKTYGYDISKIPSTPLLDIDLSKINVAISYSTKAYQFLLDQKRYYPNLKIMFWSLDVPNFNNDSSYDKNTTFEVFLEKIRILVEDNLDFLTN